MPNKASFSTIILASSSLRCNRLWGILESFRCSRRRLAFFERRNPKCWAGIGPNYRLLTHCLIFWVNYVTLVEGLTRLFLAL